MIFSILLVFFLPFVTRPEGMNPLYPKQMLSQILVSLILCAWFLRALFFGRIAWVQTKALWALAALMGWICLTVFLSSYSPIGWKALSEWVCFPLWYLLLTLTCYESWKAENLLIVFLVGGFASSGWAVGQALGMDGGAWFEIVQNQYGGRVAAGLGSPDNLAGYLLMVWPAALALYLMAKQFLARLIWSGLMVLSLLALLWTGSRVGLLGWGVEAMVFAFFYINRIGVGKRAKKILWVAASTVVFLILITPRSTRLQEFLGPRNEALWFRGAVWKGAVEMIRENPVMGVGFGAFETAFPTHRPARLMMRPSVKNTRVVHAGNWFLEWTAETGIIGLLFLLGFWGAVFAQWWRLFSANAIPKALGAGIFASFAGVGVGNLFDSNICLPTTLVPLLLFAALPVALSQRFYHLEGFPIRFHEVDLSRYRIYLLPLVILSSYYATRQLATTFNRQVADLELKKGSSSMAEGKWDEAVGFFKNSLNYDSSNVTARYLLGDTYLDRNKEGDPSLALSELEKAGRLSPDIQLIHLKKYEVLEKLNRADEAKEELKRAVRLDPMLIYLLDDFKKARDLAGAKRFEEAFIIYRNLTFDYPNCVPMLIDYANGLALARDYSSAINLYYRVLDLDPGNTKALADLRKVSDIAKKVQASKRSF